MSKILITGGAGFIGFHLAKKLAEKGEEVVIASRRIPGEDDTDFTALVKLPTLTVIEADLTDLSAWNKLGSGYDYIYHLVGINGFKQFQEIPHEVLRVGLTTTLNAITWLRDTNKNPNAKILYTSSNEVYAGTENAYRPLPIPTPENIPGVIADPYDPRWSYGGHKLICELLFIHSSKAYNFRMVIVRPHYIYGPRAGSHPMIPKMIQRIKDKIEPFPILGGSDSRPYCYVDDAVLAMIAAMESEKTDGGTYNIGGNEQTTIKELIFTLFELMNWQPQNIEYKDSPDLKVNHFMPDVSKLKQATGWDAKTSLKDGLKNTIKWYKSNSN